MERQHVTHLLARHVHGQLRPAQHRRVVNHIRACASCRAALAREERFAEDLRREMPALGHARATQLAGVWAGVLGEIAPGTASRRSGRHRSWLPGLGVVLATALVLMVALPILAATDWRVEAAPQQPRPISTSSPTPGATDTLEGAVLEPLPTRRDGQIDPQATVAYVPETSLETTGPAAGPNMGATPAPMPGVTVSPVASGW